MFFSTIEQEVTGQASPLRMKKKDALYSERFLKKIYRHVEFFNAALIYRFPLRNSTKALICLNALKVADSLATLIVMIAVVWHYWLGLVLLVVGGLAIVNLIIGYVAQVTMKKYPNRKQRKALK